MNKNWILIGGVLLCFGVSMIVDVLWVRIAVVGVALLLVVGMLIWLKLHSISYVKKRARKLIRQKGYECTCRSGDFYVIMNEKKYKVTFLESGWRVNRALIEARILMPYYDKLSRNERCLFVEDANEECPYVKMIDMGDCIKCGYMGMFEYASDLFNGLESAEYYILEQADHIYNRIMRHADAMGWVKRDAEGNVIDEDENDVQEKPMDDGKKPHNGRVVVHGLFEHKKDE